MKLRSLLTTTLVGYSLIVLLISSIDILSEIKKVSDTNNTKMLEAQNTANEQAKIIEKLKARIQVGIDSKLASQVRVDELTEVASAHVSTMQTKLTNFEKVNIDNTIADYPDVPLLINPYDEVPLFVYNAGAVLLDDVMAKYHEITGVDDYIVNVEIAKENDKYYSICNVISKTVTSQEVTYTSTVPTTIATLSKSNLEPKVVFKIKGGN